MEEPCGRSRLRQFEEADRCELTRAKDWAQSKREAAFPLFFGDLLSFARTSSFPMRALTSARIGFVRGRKIFAILARIMCIVCTLPPLLPLYFRFRNFFFRTKINAQIWKILKSPYSFGKMRWHWEEWKETVSCAHKHQLRRSLVGLTDSEETGSNQKLFHFVSNSPAMEQPEAVTAALKVREKRGKRRGSSQHFSSGSMLRCSQGRSPQVVSL